MRKQSALTFLVLAIFFHVVFVTAGYGQRLYNKQRDEQAQAALPLAQALKNGELFEKQLKNLRSLARKDFETEFLVTKMQINAFSLSLLTWANAHELVCQTEFINTDEGLSPTPDEIKAALDKLKAEISEAKKALTAFKEAAKLNEEKKEGEPEEEKGESVLTTMFARLGDLESLEKFAEQASKAGFVNTKTLATISEITEIMGTLKKVYDAYTEKVEGFNKLNADLAELRVILKKVAIQSLQVDEEHWKNIASIRARRELERADILRLISQYKGIIHRLRLVDFDPGQKDPKHPAFFCKASTKATDVEDFVDIRPRQLITEHLRELVRRGLQLEKENQEVLVNAREALPQLRDDATPAELRAITARTRTAMLNSIRSIRSRELLSQLESEILNGAPNKESHDKGLVGDLAALDAAGNSAAVKRALRFVIIHGQKNTARTRDLVGDVPQALYIISGLIARGSTPNRLADVRMAQELHAYSIRKSAVRARAYELTVSTGAQRLALFHKGGIKPTEIAQLVFAASNLAITPAILAR